jgi:DNA excision repair protein ERCC-4
MINHWWINLISIPNRLSGSYWIPTNGQTATNGTANWHLPALKGLGELSHCRPVIAVDSREQDRLKFTHLESKVVGLFTGDYSLYKNELRACIERKSIADLIGSISVGRERFERELIRMRGYPFRRLVIIGDRSDIEEHRYRSRMLPKAILHTLAAYEIRFEVPVSWFPTPEAAGRQVESWIWWIAYEITQNSNDLLRGSGMPVVHNVPSE